MASYIVRDINAVTKRIETEMAEFETRLGRPITFSEYAAIALDYIYERAKSTGKITLEDQHLLGGILGSMLHESYCESRKLDKPNEQGLANNPREKKLTDPMDAEFVQEVLDGKIPQSETLYVKDGVVCMDIANTEFIKLSPYWKKDNYMAGKTAARSVITCWDGLTHENPEVQKFVTVAVANSIHEAWISRGNVYYDEYQGEVFTNEELDNALIFLDEAEQKKDVEHMIMANNTIGKIVSAMHTARRAMKTDGPANATPEDAAEAKPETPTDEPGESEPGE